MKPCIAISLSPTGLLVTFLLFLGALRVEASDGKEKVNSFRPLRRFLVPDGGSAEIISATPDGKRLIYTNAVLNRVGIVDISRVRDRGPILLSDIAVDGEPTSVAVAPDGSHALVCVRKAVFAVGAPPVPTRGEIAIVDLDSGMITGSIPIGTYGPDALAVTRIQGETVAVVAIENEPILVDANGNYVAGDAPGQANDIGPKGFVQVIVVNWSQPILSEIADVRFDDEAQLAALGCPFPADPQPEFVDIRGTRAAVTLQENNGIAIIDIGDPRNPALKSLFSQGKVADRPADLKRDGAISFADAYPSGAGASATVGMRMSDSIAWNRDGTVLFTADEGELNFTGGRGWSAWRPDGTFLWDDAGALEQEAAFRGQYSDARSASRGVEMEGLDTGVFGDREFAFVASERGGFLAVYDITKPLVPSLVQLLPTGVRPEGVLAIPSRRLLLTADEGDGVSGTISIFEGIGGLFTGTYKQPVLRAASSDGFFAGLSGLAADPTRERALFAVPDDALVSTIYRIEALGKRASIVKHAAVTKGGAQAKYDLEGIAFDSSIQAPAPSGGFWLAAEGNARFGASNYLPNLLVQTDGAGAVLDEIRLPEDVDPSTKPASADGKIRNNGLQGVCVSSDGRHVLACIQREYLNEPAVRGILHTRIARWSLETDAWEFFLYPLEITTLAGDSIGLAELVNLGMDSYAVIERDRQLGSLAAVKRVYLFRLDGVVPFPGVVGPSSDLTGKVIQKRLLTDVLDDFTPFERVDGLALTRGRTLWAVLDNNAGAIEPRFVRLGWLTPFHTVFRWND